APALAVIRQNLSTLKLEAQVMPTSVLAALKRLEGEFDLILADPPYAIAGQELPQVLAQIEARGLLAEGGLIALEHQRGEALPEAVGTLALRRRYPYSGTEVSLYERR